MISVCDKRLDQLTCNTSFTCFQLNDTFVPLPSSCGLCSAYFSLRLKCCLLFGQLETGAGNGNETGVASSSYSLSYSYSLMAGVFGVLMGHRFAPLSPLSHFINHSFRLFLVKIITLSNICDPTMFRMCWRKPNCRRTRGKRGDYQDKVRLESRAIKDAHRPALSNYQMETK